MSDEPVITPEAPASDEPQLPEPAADPPRESNIEHQESTVPNPTLDPIANSAPPEQPSSDPLTKTEGPAEQSEGQKSTAGPPPAPALNIQPSTFNPIDPYSTFDVGTLSDNDLKAAAALYLKRNHAAISAKGVAKRKQTMELNLREIVDYLSRNNGAPLRRIARHTNITAGTTSKYLRQLIAAGKVRAEGWAKNSRYYLR